MTTLTRNLTQIDGANVVAPTQNGFSTTSWEVFANDAAYEAVYGAGQQGDCYFNSTDLLLRAHNGTAWVYLQNGINALTDSSTTGAAQDLDPTYHNLLKVSNASLTSVRSLDSAKTLICYLNNSTGSDITILHDDGTATAAKRILLPDNSNLTLADGNTAHFVYDALSSRWRYTNAVGDGGSGTGTGAKNYVTSPDSSTSVTDVGGSVSTDTTTVADLPEESKGIGVLITQTSGAIGNTSTFEVTAIDEGDGGSNGAPEMYYKTKSGYTDDDCSIQWYNSDTATVLYTQDIKAGSGRISKGVADIPLTTGENIKPRIYWNVTDSNGLVVSGAGTLADTRLVGALSTDWQSYTPSNTQGFGTITSNTLQWRITGQSVEIRGDFVAGTVAGSEAQIELPNSYTIDLKGAGSNGVIVGSAASPKTSGVVIQNLTTLATHGDTYFNFGRAASGTVNSLISPANANGIVDTGQRFTLFASVPIAEVDGSVMFGTEAQAQNARTRFYLASNTAYTANTAVPFDTISTRLRNLDGINNTAGSFSVDTDGDYEIKTFVRNNTSFSTAGLIRIYKNGAIESNVGSMVNTQVPAYGTDTIYLKTTDTFSIRLNAAFTAVGGEADTWVTIARVADKSSKATGFPFADQIPGEYGMVKAVKWQRRVLTGSVSTTQSNITDMRLENLVVGDVYRVSLSMNATVSGASTAETAELLVKHNGSTILKNRTRDDQAGDSQGHAAGNSRIFVATATVVSVDSFIQGTANISSTDTWIEIESLTTHEKTESTDFTP